MYTIGIIHKHVHMFLFSLYMYMLLKLCYIIIVSWKRCLAIKYLIQEEKKVIILPLTEKQKQTRYEYAKKNLKRIPLDVQKDKYEEIKAASEKACESINGYIKKAIDERMEREL